jgi:hypothetical protein
MSDEELSTGGSTGLGDWGYPSELYNYNTGYSESGGMVWQGGPPATQADRDQCRAAVHHDPVRFDARSLCGKDDPDWTTFTEVNQDKEPYTQDVVL